MNHLSHQLTQHLFLVANVLDDVSRFCRKAAITPEGSPLGLRPTLALVIEWQINVEIGDTVRVLE